MKPPKRPCGSCPYRRDVPSGVWDASEYAKLIEYDRPTGEQPTGVFLCHQCDGCLCGGWLQAHDAYDLLSLRFAFMQRLADPADVLDYTSDVPCFDSGAQAATHGLADIDNPGPAALELMRKLGKVLLP